MKTGIKTLFAAIILLLCGSISAQTPDMVVKEFTENFQQYVSNINPEQARARIDKIAPNGENYSCIVYGNICREISRMDDNNSSSNIHLEEFMSRIKLLNVDGAMSINFSEPVWEKDIEEPNAGERSKYNKAYFVRCRMEITGDKYLAQDNLYKVRNGRIIAIYDFANGITMGEALRLYSKKKYNEAFKIFRELSHQASSNMQSVYYATVMMLDKHGCKDLSKYVREQEILWNIYRMKHYKYEEVNLFISRLHPDFNKLVFRKMYNNQEYSGLLSMGLYRHGLIPDKKGDKCGYINDNGEVVIDYKYDKVYPFEDCGMALVYNNGKYGYINDRGYEVTDINYDWAARIIGNDRSLIYNNDTRLYSLIDLNLRGKVIKTFSDKYDDGFTFYKRKYITLEIKNKDKMDLYDYNGNLLEENLDKGWYHYIEGRYIFYRDRERIEKDY